MKVKLNDKEYDLASVSERCEYWSLFAQQKLVGRTITTCRYQTDDEMNMMGWCQHALVIFFDNGDNLILSRDDEGNGPGAAFLSDATLPVL